MPPCNDTWWFSERLLISVPIWRKFLPRIWWANRAHLNDSKHDFQLWLTSFLPCFHGSFLLSFSFSPLVRLFDWFVFWVSPRILQTTPMVRFTWMVTFSGSSPHSTWNRGTARPPRHERQVNACKALHHKHPGVELCWRLATDSWVASQNQLQLWSQCSSHLPQDGMRMLSPDLKCIKWKIGFQTRVLTETLLHQSQTDCTIRYNRQWVSPHSTLWQEIPSTWQPQKLWGCGSQWGFAPSSIFFRSALDPDATNFRMYSISFSPSNFI